MNTAKQLEIRGPNAEQQRLKKTLLKQLEEDRAVMMLKQPFTALLAMRLRMVTVVDDRMPTACTDGETMFFNAEFMSGRSNDDRRFILAHEVWHCVLAHSLRSLGRDHARWNIACDYEVNHILHSELGYHPEDVLFNSAFMHLSAEQVYDQLSKKKARKVKQKPLDIHNIWEAFASQGVLLDPDFSPRQQGNKVQQQKDAESWRQQLANAAHQTRMAGNMPGHLGLSVDKLLHPKANWEQLLQRFVTRNLPCGERQWLPPSRRHIHRGLYLPASRGNRLEIAVAIDTSASCVRDVGRFVSELIGILGAFNQVNLSVTTFDTDIRQRLTLTEHDLYCLKDLVLNGGGGTNFHFVFNEYKDNAPQALIVFTDGYASAPADPGYPVLWVLTPDGRSPVKWGESILLSAT